MSFVEKTDLLKVILRVFPNAVVLERKSRNPQSAIGADVRSLAKRANPPRVDSRVCKRKGFNPGQLSLFDDGRAGK